MSEAPAPRLGSGSTKLSPSAATPGRQAVLAHLPLLGVALAFVVSTLVIPTLAPVSISDDWIYSMSVRSLVEQGTFRILPDSAANAVFQILWASAFCKVFGFSLGVLRVSTVVLVALSGWAFYGCCRELVLPRSWAALGMAAYLFSPLMLPLSFTFMTDANFVGVSVMALYGYLRGLRGPGSHWAFLMGSVAAAAAASIRPQGVLLVAAVSLFLVGTRRVRLDLAGFRTLLVVAAVPFATTVGLYVAFAVTGNGPSTQTAFVEELVSSSGRASVLFVGKVLAVAVMYVGLFASPLLVSALRGFPDAGVRSGPRGWRMLLLLVPPLLLLGVLVLTREGRLMPYSGQFFNPFGFIPQDLVGMRAPIFGPNAQVVLTVVAVCAALVLVGLAAVRFAREGEARRSPGAPALVAVVAVASLLGSVLTSFYFLGHPAFGPTLDRYLLPLVPVTIALSLRLLRQAGARASAAWVAVAVVAAVSVLGTRDALLWQREVWRFADETQAAGVPLNHLEGGAAWSAWHTYGTATGVAAPPGVPVPFWISLFKLPLDPEYIIVGSPPPNTVLVAERGYSQWLSRSRQKLYLVRRPDAAPLDLTTLPRS